MTLTYMAQHCSTAGIPVRDPEERYGEDWRDSMDLYILDGTESEHVEWAQETLARKPWCGHFLDRIANDVLRYFGASIDVEEEEADSSQR